MRRLGEVRAALVARNAGAVATWNDGAREERRRLLEADLAGGEVHELRVGVPNRPGVVAEIALHARARGRQHPRHGALPTADRASGSIALWVAGAQRAEEAQVLVEGLGLTVSRP